MYSTLPNSSVKAFVVGVGVGVRVAGTVAVTDGEGVAVGEAFVVGVVVAVPSGAGP